MSVKYRPGTGREPRIFHESMGLPSRTVVQIDWWTCPNLIVKDEQFGNRELCDFQNPSWEHKCQGCGADRPDKS